MIKTFMVAKKIIFHSIDMQKLGQHFLKNPAVLEKIADALSLADGDRVVEVGSGHGELTEPLVRAAWGTRCHILCIEKDHALIKGLELLAAQENSSDGGVRIKIVEGDILKLLPTLAAMDKIVGNIPYYITGKLLRILSEVENKPERAVLLVQKEVAERICATPPSMNRLSASVQFWADPAIAAMVPRKDFSPPPKVDSAIVVLNKKDFVPESAPWPPGRGPSVDPQQYYRAVRAIFAQPRKTLLNNLASMGDGDGAKNDIAARLESINIDPGARPQDLGIDQIIAIAKAPLWG